MTALIKKLQKLAEKSGVECIKKGEGHYHLKGPLLVNYYPLSKKRTAYVAGTTRGKHHCTPEKAIGMCFTPPPYASKDEKDKRKVNTRRIRMGLINRGVINCFWCNSHLNIDNSTLEHIIPISRGGLDNANNRTLSCDKCNSDRGSGMPELDRLEVSDD